MVCARDTHRVPFNPTLARIAEMDHQLRGIAGGRARDTRAHPGEIGSARAGTAAVCCGRPNCQTPRQIRGVNGDVRAVCFRGWGSTYWRVVRRTTSLPVAACACLVPGVHRITRSGLPGRARVPGRIAQRPPLGNTARSRRSDGSELVRPRTIGHQDPVQEGRTPRPIGAPRTGLIRSGRAGRGGRPGRPNYPARREFPAARLNPPALRDLAAHPGGSIWLNSCN
jgi:hypothetical protein